ncbi:glycosyltransferase family 2 protein [Chitinophaga lutea]
MHDITASIVLYKSDPSVVTDAVRSFLDTSLNVRLFLVDNSPENSLKSLRELDERIEYLHNPSNPGFGAAHNIILKKTPGLAKYHIVLNPDVYFGAGQLEKMFDYMEKHPEVGHLMPKVLYPDGSIQYLCKENPTPFDLFARRFLPSFALPLFKSRMDRYEYRDRDYGSIQESTYLSGCFMFIRTEAFQKAGYFDERIFMYIEDADLTRRIAAHYKTIYFPFAEVYHHFAKGSHKSFRLMCYSIHGAFIYFNKWGWFNSRTANPVRS